MTALENKVDEIPNPCPGMKNGVLDAAWLKNLAEECGADAVGLVEVEREALKDDGEAIKTLLPGARTILSLAVRINPDAIRTPWMGVVNREAASVSHAVDEVAARISRRLLAHGLRSVPVHGSFPMEAQKWPGKMWSLSHKIAAEQAGIGRMGHHRLVIHPEFGTSILLSAVLLESPAATYDRPLESNPCNGCKLCVAACPTGSIRADGTFSLMNCSTHNYRYRLGGFNDWVESIADSKNRFDYRKRVRGEENIAMWQALAFGNNYTCLNCLAVCPAGSRSALTDKGAGKELAKRLLARGGSVFVLEGSDAQAYAEKRFPTERIRVVKGGNRVTSARGFLQSLPLAFQPGRAAGLEAVYHFLFTGTDSCQGTVAISDGKIRVAPGLEGHPDLTVTAEGSTWVAYLAGEAGLLSSLIRRKIRIKGSPARLKDFARCFPM